MKAKRSPKKNARAKKPRNRQQRYALRLFITGLTPRSVRAVANIKAVCEKHFDGQYRLDIVDLYQQPALSKIEQIVAAPTLIKTKPLPVRRFVGDLSDTKRLLAALNVEK